MAYINAAQVADIRARLKAEFPAKDGWKISVRLDSHLSVNVNFMAGPHTFEAWEYDPYASDAATPRSGTQAREMDSKKPVINGMVNHYYIRDHWTAKSAAILEKAYKIIARDHWDESDIQTDYFSRAFYIHIGIGQWDKPYKALDLVAA